VNWEAVSRYDGSTRQGLNQESIKIPTHVAQTAIHATGSAGAGLLVRIRIIERGTCRFVGVIELAPPSASSPDPARYLSARVFSQFARDKAYMIKSCRESGRHALSNRTCRNSSLRSEPSRKVCQKSCLSSLVQALAQHIAQTRSTRALVACQATIQPACQQA